MKLTGDLRIGIIGCGNIATGAHVPSYLSVLDLGRLTGFYDIEPANAEKALNIHNRNLKALMEDCEVADEIKEIARANLESLQVYHTVEELLANVDVVDICTPVKWHVPYAHKALASGVHVMSEKPMGLTWHQANKIKGNRPGEVFYQVNDDNVFLPKYQMLSHLIQSGAIGEVESIWLARGSHGPENNAWFWDPSISGGGCMLDYGFHAVTAAWYLLGFKQYTPKRVNSHKLCVNHRQRIIEGRLQDIAVDDDSHFTILFTDNQERKWATAVIEATWSWAELGPRSDDIKGYVNIHGTKGQLLSGVDDNNNVVIKLLQYGIGEKTIQVPETSSESHSFNAEIRNFLVSVLKKKESLLNEAIGAEVMAVLGSVYLANVKGHGITVQEFKDFVSSFQGEDSVDQKLIDIFMQPLKTEG